MASPDKRSALGSNNWVVSGEDQVEQAPPGQRPASRHPEPVHLWQVRLVIPGEEEVIGVVFPGVPEVIIGHNDLEGLA